MAFSITQALSENGNAIVARNSGTEQAPIPSVGWCQLKTCNLPRITVLSQLLVEIGQIETSNSCGEKQKICASIDYYTQAGLLTVY